MSESGYVHVEDCAILKETDAALLVDIGEEEMWLPKSQIANWQTYKPGDESVTLSITEFIARKKGIDFVDS